MPYYLIEIPFNVSYLEINRLSNHGFTLISQSRWFHVIQFFVLINILTYLHLCEKGPEQSVSNAINRSLIVLSCITLVTNFDRRWTENNALNYFTVPPEIQWKIQYDYETHRYNRPLIDTYYHIDCSRENCVRLSCAFVLVDTLYSPQYYSRS